MKRTQKAFLGGAIIIGLAALAVGCTTKSQARLQAQNAYLAGQNTALRQQQSLSVTNNITIVGPVQNPQVPWVAGLTLVQAIATANYLDANEPKQIVITRAGESATLDANVLFNGTVVPLEAGDVVELRQ